MQVWLYQFVRSPAAHEQRGRIGQDPSSRISCLSSLGPMGRPTW
jgi:hypothetical protein